MRNERWLEVRDEGQLKAYMYGMIDSNCKGVDPKLALNEVARSIDFGVIGSDNSGIHMAEQPCTSTSLLCRCYTK